MNSNYTTMTISTPNPARSYFAFYTLLPFFFITMAGCVVAMVLYVKRRVRLDELRHRLIPIYTYDPAEDRDKWEDIEGEDEQRLLEPLYKEGKLSFTTNYGA